MGGVGNTPLNKALLVDLAAAVARTHQAFMQAAQGIRRQPLHRREIAAATEAAVEEAEVEAPPGLAGTIMAQAAPVLFHPSPDLR